MSTAEDERESVYIEDGPLVNSYENADNELVIYSIENACEEWVLAADPVEVQE